MTQFDHWRRWGSSLSEEEFPTVWLALGVVYARLQSTQSTRGRRRIRLRLQHPRLAKQYIQEVLRDALPLATHELTFEDAANGLTSAAERKVNWVFPVLSELGYLLLSVPPKVWASIAQLVLSQSNLTSLLRLRVDPGLCDEPVAHWLKLLLNVRLINVAVSIIYKARKAKLFWEWPLRISSRPDNAAVGCIAVASDLWPTSKLTRFYELDRANSNCDILIHMGGSAALLADLVLQPIKFKTNLVILAGTTNEDESALFDRLRLISGETAASGMVVIPRSVDAENLAGMINEVINSFSHDDPFDVALNFGIMRHFAGEAIIWLSDDLADIRIRSVAARLNARARSLAPGTTIELDLRDVSSSVFIERSLEGHAAESYTPRAFPGEFRDFQAIEVSSFEMDAELLDFQSESGGASDLAIIGNAIENATEPVESIKTRAARFLQQQSFVIRDGLDTPATDGFFAGIPTVVYLRIGSLDVDWQSLPEAFPDEQLPKDVQHSRLTLWLTEPEQLDEPIQGCIILPLEGASSVCEMQFTPRSQGLFEGRISVMHRGRVLQTAVLEAAVLPEHRTENPHNHDGANHSGRPTLREIIPVRHQIGDLSGRRQFDLAFVTNHTSTATPRAVALSDQRAWISNVVGALDTAGEINEMLSKVAKSVIDYEQGLEGDEGRKLLIKLARAGTFLRIFLVNDQLNHSGNNAAIAGEEYIQIVSTRSDATVPFEFIYDFAAPADNAHLCTNWRAGVEKGRCLPDCGISGSERVCPMGFWGLSKVIERHHVSPEHFRDGKEFFLQSEPNRDCSELNLHGHVLLSSSHRVSEESLRAVIATLKSQDGITLQTVQSWDDWAVAVDANQPRMILSMPHTDGTGSNVSLEISRNTIETILLTKKHVGSKAPLVALLGCDIAGTTKEYTRHVGVFRANGAAVVVGTIATVFGDHAASVTAMLATELLKKRNEPFFLGEAIREVKRQALLKNQLMPLCVVAYGDADWRITY